MATIAESRLARPAPPSRLVPRLAVAALLAVFVVALLTTNLRLDRLLGLPGTLAAILREMLFFPEWGYFPTAWEGMVESVQMAWFGTIIGALLSFPLGFLGAKNVSGAVVSNVVRQLLNAIRAFPTLVLAILLIPLFGLGSFTGAVAIGLHSIGTLGKLTAELIEGIDRGPVEAARAAGGDQGEVLRWGVVPQVLPEIVAFWIYRFELNVRESAILGVVGAGGIGVSLVNTINYGRYGKAGMALVVVVATVIILDTLSARLRRRIIEGGEGPAAGALMEEPELAELAAADVR